MTPEKTLVTEYTVIIERVFLTFITFISVTSYLDNFMLFNTSKDQIMQDN